MAKAWQTDGAAALEEKAYRVIKIEAQEQPKKARLRVAAYTRVSSDSEDQFNSFAAQNRYYNAYGGGQRPRLRSSAAAVRPNGHPNIDS